MKDGLDKFMENNIDINQYIQYDESGHRRLYFNLLIRPWNEN